MMTNKRNMTTETSGVMFIFSRSDVAQPMCCTSESNYHVYGMWRQILREFNIEQLVHIVDKQRVKMKAIFYSHLLTPMSASDFKGYQETFHGFVSILKSAVLVVPPSGPINVDPDIPAVI